MFITTAEFLPQHHQQLDATRALITRAETDGHTRLAEMNRTVETNPLAIGVPFGNTPLGDDTNQTQYCGKPN